MNYNNKCKGTKLSTKDVPMGTVDLKGKKTSKSSLSKLGADARKGLDIKPARVR